MDILKSMVPQRTCHMFSHQMLGRRVTALQCKSTNCTFIMLKIARLNQQIKEWEAVEDCALAACL